ncbi:MAG: hypothetical protein NVSMB45_03410 [Ginsengibacter sp.]
MKGVRSSILQFIKEQLKKNEGGEGGNIKNIQLYITAPEPDEHIYRAAVFSDEIDKFKQDEVQKIADDFDISLPENWKFEVYFNELPPRAAILSHEVDASLMLITNKSKVEKRMIIGFIRTLNGETTKKEYQITSDRGKVNIGREKSAQTSVGYFRKNYIAFVNSENNPANWSVSRQHAHIEWNEAQDAFYIYADDGGIPPNNKMKVRGENGIVEKIQTTEMGHRLNEGDQIILGDSAVLEFSYKSEGELK